MSVGVKVVPWADWSEWAELRSRIAAGDHAGAGATLALYRLRRPGSLPLAVQSTAELAMLLDFSTPQEPHARRLALSMAIVRLVNGATDRIQPRADGAAARSVHSLAKALRLPPILVELRHQATHNTLPRLDALVDAGHEAMAWLEAEYWRPQADAAAKHIDRDSIAQGHERDDWPKNSYDEDSGRDACGREPAVADVEKLSSIGKGGTRKRPRDRWEPSGNPSEWKGVPIGMLPGQAKARSLIGIDVGSVIGRNWRPTVSEGLPGPSPIARLPLGHNCSGERGAGAVERTEEEGCVDDQAGETGDKTRSVPFVKARRVLSDAEKSTVEQMMRKLLSKPILNQEMDE
jgi:hypothetical protein